MLSNNETKEISKVKKEISKRNISELIDLICDYAKSKNRSAMQDLINQGVDIHNSDVNESVLQRLIAEKYFNLEAILFLEKEFNYKSDPITLAKVVDKYTVQGKSCLSFLNNGILQINKSPGKLESEITHISFTESSLAMYTAGWKADLALTEELILKGGSVDYATLGAATTGKHEFVRMLMGRGANPNFALMGAVRRNDWEFTEELIKHGASLDLAIQEAAMIDNQALMEVFLKRGADITMAVAGAVQGSNYTLLTALLIRNQDLVFSATLFALFLSRFDIVDNLIKDGFSLMLIMRAAACLDKIDYIEKLRQLGANVYYAALGAAQGGKLSSLIKFIHQMDDFDITFIAQILADYHHLDSEKDVLRLLCALNKNKQKELLQELKQNSKYKSIDIDSLISHANAITNLSKAKEITIEQSIAWEAEELQGLFGFSFVSKDLPQDILMIIGTYLSGLSEKESKALYNKMPLEIRKNNLTIDLNNYQQSDKSFILFRDRRPMFFSRKFQKSTTEKELSKCILHEICNQSQEDLYTNILRKHS